MFFRKKNRKIINPVLKERPRIKTKNEVSIVKKVLYWSILLAFFGVVFYSIFFSGFLAVTDIVVQGAEKIDPLEVNEEINFLISGKHLNFLPKNNIILVSKKRTKNLLSEKFKLIKNIIIKKNFPNSLSISIAEKKPMLIMRSRGQDYVIDDKGIAFGKSDFESSFLNENVLSILEDESDREIFEKEEALDPEYINFILAIREGLIRDLNLKLTQTVKTSSIVSGDVILETEEGWKIYASKGVGKEKEIEMLKAVLGEKIENDKRKDLEYIDLRTDNKVYYKFKNFEQNEGSSDKKKDEDKK